MGKNTYNIEQPQSNQFKFSKRFDYKFKPILKEYTPKNIDNNTGIKGILTEYYTLFRNKEDIINYYNEDIEKINNYIYGNKYNIDIDITTSRKNNRYRYEDFSKIDVFYINSDNEEINYNNDPITFTSDTIIKIKQIYYKRIRIGYEYRNITTSISTLKFVNMSNIYIIKPYKDRVTNKLIKFDKQVDGVDLDGTGVNYLVIQGSLSNYLNLIYTENTLFDIKNVPENKPRVDRERYGRLKNIIIPEVGLVLSKSNNSEILLNSSSFFEYR